MIAQIIFSLILAFGIFLFTKNVRKIVRNIRLGRDLNRSDKPKERWMTMIRVALGQSKMVMRPVAGILHFFIYVGFVVINLEVLEILIDGVFGTHRVFAPLGNLYNLLIWSFEILALLVLTGCVVFLIRRNVIKLKRFWMREMTSWPRTDANIILITEILLMAAFLTLNATDGVLQSRNVEHYVVAGFVSKPVVNALACSAPV